MQAEDTQVTINMDRRKDALRNYLIFVHQLIEKEKKGKDGNVSSIYIQPFLFDLFCPIHCTIELHKSWLVVWNDVT